MQAEDITSNDAEPLVLNNHELEKSTSVEPEEKGEIELISLLYKKPHFTVKDIDDIVGAVNNISKDNKIIKDLDSDRKRVKYYKKLNLYISPISKPVNINSSGKFETVQTISLKSTFEMKST